MARACYTVMRLRSQRFVVYLALSVVSCASCRRAGSVEAEVPAWLVEALATSARLPKKPPSLAGVCKKPSPVDDIESLAAPGRTIIRCCDANSGGFTFGCLINHDCVYFIGDAQGWTKVSTRDQLARAIAPVTSAGQALGLVALLDEGHSLTTTRPKLEVIDEPTRARKLTVVGADVVSNSKGFSVRLLNGPFCTCPQSVTLHTYQVTTSGSVEHRSSENVVDDGQDHCPE
jgi:hypothetical protein